VILVLPILGIVLTFARLGRRLVTKAWTATEGSLVARFALATVVVAGIGGLAYTWLPNGDYRKIGPTERGTIGEGFAAVVQIPAGRPSLVPEEKAVERGTAPDETRPGTMDTTVPATSTTKVGATATTAAVTPSTLTETPTTVGRSSASTTSTLDESTTTTRPRATTTTAVP